MTKIKMRGAVIYCKDVTVPMTDKEEKKAKELGVKEFRFPKTFRVKINAAFPPSHRIYEM